MVLFPVVVIPYYMNERGAGHYVTAFQGTLVAGLVVTIQLKSQSQ